MLPNFLGIGVPRSGSTWLYELLKEHPEVAVPPRRKEIHFFDRYYGRGTGWYESFFPPDAEASQYKAVGEITPHYLYNDQCPARMASMPSLQHLIVILRNPTERAFSHYIWRMRMDNYQAPFEQFLVDWPQAVEWGRYAGKLRNYFRHFPRDRFLILIHEEMFHDVMASRQRVADFLGIDAARFDEGAGTRRVNPGRIPRFRTLTHVVSHAAARMRRYDLDWIPNLGKKLGVKRLLNLESKGPTPTLPEEWRRRLDEMFADEIEELETLLDRDLSVWKQR